MDTAAQRLKTPRQRFDEKVRLDPATGCLEWTGGRKGKGYGSFWCRGKGHIAPRWAWEEENGPIPEGLILLHRCHNRLCVNLAHLRLGTHAENLNDVDFAGEAHSAAHVSDEDVRKAVELHTVHGVPQAEIARRLGVASSTVCGWVHGTWRGIAAG